MLIELKCPITAKSFTSGDFYMDAKKILKKDNTLPYLNYNYATHLLELDKNHDYYFQIQRCHLDAARLVVFASDTSSMVTVHCDDSFISNMLHKLFILFPILFARIDTAQSFFTEILSLFYLAVC